MSTSKTKSKGGKVSQVANGTSDHKNQPTAEQLRIARMAADKTDTDPEMMKKIKEISDLTGRSPDEAYTALHDCNGDANQAVDLLFEKVNHQDEWHEMKKKRKPTAANRAQAESAQNSQAADRPTDKSDNWENSEGQTEFHGRGRRDRGTLRFGRGAGRGAGRGSVNGTSNSRERTGDRPGAPDRTHDGTRGRRRGAGAGRPGGRNFRDRDNSFEPQNIELWSNSIAENGKEAESWNNNDEWANADDWDGSLEESLVLTRSVPAMNRQPAQMAGGGFAMNSGAPAEVVHQMTPKAQQQLPPYHYPGPMKQHVMDRIQRDQKVQQQDVSYNLQEVQSQDHHHHLGQQQHQGTDIASLSAHTSAYGSVIRSLVQGMPDSYSPQVPHSSAMYLSHYAKEATECIKNAVGIGSNNSPGRNMAAAGHHAAPLLEQLKRAKTQQYLPQQHMKSKVPSKIPQSAVEMPGSMSSMQLDVQFGNWDSPSNAGLLSSGSQQNQSEIIQDKQGMNLQQYMSGNLPPTVASMSNLHVQNAHDTLHLKSTVEDMMGSSRVDDRRQAVAETVGSSGSLGSSGLTSGSGGAYQASATVEVSGGKMSFTSAPTPEDRKPHAFSQQQQPSGYGQMQSSSTTQMEKSLLSSTFQQQADQQGMGLGSLGLSSSLGNTPSTISNPSSSTASTSSGGSHPSSVGHSTADVPISASTPSQHPHHPPNSQLQYPYGLVRGSDGAAGNPSAYMYNQQFSKGYGGEKQPSSLVFDSSTNVSNLYQSPYHHMPSSAYPGSSGMYLGGGSSYLPTSNVGGNANVGSFHGSGSGAYQGGNLGSSGGESSAQAPPSFHHHPSSSSNYPSASLPGDGVFHNQSGHLFRNASFRSPLEQESFQRDGSNVGTGSQQSSSMSSGIPMSSGPNKLASDLSKLGLKDSASTSSAPNAVTGGGQFDQASNMISVASLTTATNTTSSANLSTSVTSTSASVGTTKSSNSQLSLSSKSATQTTTGKHMMNYQGNVNLLNTNYMISQPPGFQLAPFGYQHSQQALTGYAYDDMQAQHFNVGGSYVDVPFQMTNAMQGRSGQQMSAQSQTFGGSDTKLTPLEPTQPGGSLQPQQPATGSASQQFHPYSGFNYINYIPGTGLMPYIPVMPMSGMAVPMPTNPALQASVPSSQYQQKPGGVYGSQHAFNMGGGQSQDFTKGFNQSQTTLAKSANGGTQASSHGDMLLASGSGFNKQHVQGFDKAGFHGGTPPSSFGLNVPGGTQTGTPGAGPAMYSGPFMPVMGHPNHSQILHHTMVAQEMSLGNRGAGAGQQKVGPNKSYNAPYWSGGN